MNLGIKDMKGSLILKMKTIQDTVDRLQPPSIKKRKRVKTKNTGTI